MWWFSIIDNFKHEFTITYFISNRNIYIVSVNYIFIARQGPVSPYGAHQVQAKMQITIQIRQQRRMIANNNKFESSYVHKALVYCSSYSTEVNLTFIKDLHIGGEHPDEE